VIPTANGGSSMAGLGSLPEWAEGRIPEGYQNGKIKILAWAGCPSAFGRHLSLLQPGSESLGLLRREV